MHKILNLWETPVIKDHKIFPNHAEILSTAIKCTGKEDHVGKFLQGKHINFEPEIHDLKKWIITVAEESIQEINKEFWDQKYRAKFLDIWSWSSTQYNNPYHSHPNTSWAGVYCVEPGDKSEVANNGSTVLYSPLSWGTYLDAGVAFLDRQAYQINNLDRGDLLLFPGYVRHSAMYFGANPRTIIAFNLIFE